MPQSSQLSLSRSRSKDKSESFKSSGVLVKKTNNIPVNNIELSPKLNEFKKEKFGVRVAEFHL